LDSFLGTEAEAYYRDFDVPILKLANQDHTDIEKTLILFKKRYGGDGNVVVWCNFDGTRMDHEFSNYNTLYAYADDFLSLFLLSQNSAVAIIPRGETTLLVADSMMTIGESKKNYCGLIPIFGPVHNIETKGLKWNCGPGFSKFKFGSMVSTSNEILSKWVVFKTSDPFLFTMTMNCHNNSLSSYDQKPSLLEKTFLCHVRLIFRKFLELRFEDSKAYIPKIIEIIVEFLENAKTEGVVHIESCDLRVRKK